MPLVLSPVNKVSGEGLREQSVSTESKQKDGEMCCCQHSAALMFSQQTNTFPYDIITQRTWKMTDVRRVWQRFQTRPNLFLNPLFIQGCNSDTTIGPHPNSLGTKGFTCRLNLRLNFLHSPGFSSFTSSQLHLARGDNWCWVFSRTPLLRNHVTWHK